MISEMDFPVNTRINGKERNAFYRDSFKVAVSKSNLEAKHVYHGIFGFLPKPVQLAFRFRNAIVKYLGFSTSETKMSVPLESIAEGNKAGFLTIEFVEQGEVVCGAYENNMDMWISVLKLSEQEFSISTLVNLKTRSSKMYMAVIKPFHKIVAKYCIKQALTAGRI